MPARKTPLFVACEKCGDEFACRRTDARYCSQACSKQARRRGSATCPQCGGTFAPSRYGQTYCSKRCVSLFAASRPKPRPLTTTLYPTRQVNGRAIREHRVVAEETLGCPLRHGEVVHHVDGDHRNNDPSNLLVMPNQAAHMVLHRRLEAQARTPNERT